MPHLPVNGARLYYEARGAGPEAVVFAHGILWSGAVFHDQVSALKDRYRCITFDFRGHGQSEVTRSGYDPDTLSDDAAALIERLQCAPCHFVGHSLGSFVGMRLAIGRPELLRSLILLAASPDPEPWGNRVRYRVLGLVYRWFGLGPVADQIMPVLLGKNVLSDPQRAPLRQEWRGRLAANDRVGVGRAIRGVLRRRGVYDRLQRIAIPTLILAGDQDVAAPPAKAERIHARIPGSVLRIIPGAGHTPTLETPAETTREIELFLNGLWPGLNAQAR